MVLKSSESKYETNNTFFPNYLSRQIIYSYTFADCAVGSVLRSPQSMTFSRQEQRRHRFGCISQCQIELGDARAVRRGGKFLRPIRPGKIRPEDHLFFTTFAALAILYFNIFTRYGREYAINLSSNWITVFSLPAVSAGGESLELLRSPVGIYWPETFRPSCTRFPCTGPEILLIVPTPSRDDHAWSRTFS